MIVKKEEKILRLVLPLRSIKKIGNFFYKVTLLSDTLSDIPGQFVELEITRRWILDLLKNFDELDSKNASKKEFFK